MNGCVVELAPRAEHDVEALSPEVALRIARKLKLLERDPRARGDTVKRLQGFDTPTFRLRTGDYRAVFRV